LHIEKGSLGRLVKYLGQRRKERKGKEEKSNEQNCLYFLEEKEGEEKRGEKGER